MNNNSNNDNLDSQTVLNQIVLEFMREQRRKRRWRWITRILILLFFVFLLFKIPSWSERDKGGRTKPHAGMIDLKGTIDAENDNADSLAKGLDAAYKNAGLKAVIIRIDSPGGSPVQADYMYNTVQYYRKRYPDIKIYAVCVDICASAAYYVAAAAESIYADPSSMVGSIGVLYNGFGFVDTLQKLGVSRRLYTAGKNKDFLDPFSPQTPEQVKLLQTMLDDVHQQFINKVKEGRGNRLKIDEDTFSGLFWTGVQAKERGLIDGFASTGGLAREILKLDQLIDYTYKPSLFDRMSKSIGTALANQLPVALGLKPSLVSATSLLSLERNID